MSNTQKQSIGEVSELSFAYKDALVLDGINLEIKSGETLSILGPNGAGKTTLIKSMLGQVSTRTGAINILGHQPGSIALKRLSGVMLQISGLPDMSTVSEHIKLFQSYYPDPMSYQKVLEYSGLKNKEYEYSKHLSGGQKQRLLFALAICGNPKVLFLDEPTVGMDIDSRKALWKAIEELKATGTSILLTTHYLEEADKLSDRIIILNNGRITKEGTPAEIKSYTDVKTVKFQSSVHIEHFLNAISVDQYFDNALNQHCYSIVSHSAEKLLKDLFKRAFQIQNLTVAGADLEQAFSALNLNSVDKGSILEVA
ncbi:ABC transporter ATP-binding protein [Shewanella sp. OPT22]|nr:ABC transporter ATP-binding protein [Shewanella sp. OPT22]